MFRALGLTVAYSIRLVYFTFISSSNVGTTASLCDTDRTLSFPIINLTFLALLSGATLSWLIFPFPNLILLPREIKLLTSLIIIASGTLALSLVQPRFNFFPGSFFSNFNLIIWNIPVLRGQGSSRRVLPTGIHTLKIYDTGWLELSSKDQVAKTTQGIGLLLNFVQKNNLKTHFLLFLAWLLLFSIFIYFYSLNLKRDTEDVKIRIILWK
jgi:hypothetical protein